MLKWMDMGKLLQELRVELRIIDEVIAALEQLAALQLSANITAPTPDQPENGEAKIRRGRPPKVKLA